MRISASGLLPKHAAVTGWKHSPLWNRTGWNQHQKIEARNSGMWTASKVQPGFSNGDARLVSCVGLHVIKTYKGFELNISTECTNFKTSSLVSGL